MSILVLEDLTIESSIKEGNILENASQLVLEFSYNGKARGKVNLSAREATSGLWEARNIPAIDGSAAFLLISVWIELGTNGHQMLLGFKGLNGRDLYRAIGNKYEAPLTCHQNYPALTLKTTIMIREKIQSKSPSTGNQGASSGETTTLQRALDAGFDAYQRFARYGNMASLDEAISNFQTAIMVIPGNHPSRPDILSNLGSCLSRRFEQLGRLSDLNDAVVNLEAAVDLAPNNHQKSTHLQNLGSSLLLRFERLKNIADINNAIARYQAAINLTPFDYEEKHQSIGSLGNALRIRFQRLGSVSDINNAIVHLEAAVNLTPDTDPSKHSHLTNLGKALQFRFRQFGNTTDIDEAIERLEAAVDLISKGRPEALDALNTLGTALLARFEWIGNIADIDNAIARLEAAADLLPDGFAYKPIALVNLATSLENRYKRFGNLADLDNAIARLQAAVDLAPDDHPYKHSALNNLGNVLEKRFHRLRSITDIDKSIMVQQAAVDLTPEGFPEKAGRLSNLGRCYQTRFEYFGEASDLHNSIKRQQVAVDLTPEDHPQRPVRLASLGSSLCQRFRQLGDTADIDNAIAQQQIAVDLTPDGHPSKLSILIEIGNSFAIRGHHLRRPEDIESAISYVSEAALSRGGAPNLRLSAAEQWTSLAEPIKHQSLLDAYECVLDLIPLTAWLGLSISDRHRHLIRMGEHARNAVASAISLGEYDKALEWLEQGRSVVWTQILHLRTPVDRLRDANADLADRLLEISQQLDRGIEQIGSSSEEIRAMEEKSRRYRALTTEWETIIEQVRSLPNFETFLKPPSSKKLMKAAQDGPVIVLNIATTRCDALAIVPGLEEIAHIPLPNITFSRVQELQDDLKHLLTSNGIRLRGERAAQRVTDDSDEKDCRHILAELWCNLVKPVIDPLALSPHPDILPHIWWCVTGPLAFLPIHAAGIYDADAVDSQLTDYAISSYIPTVSTLLESSDSEMESSFRLLSVIQSSAPGASPIPNTKEELTYIRRRLANRDLVVLEDDQGTKRKVMKEMERCNWLHLACHGVQRLDEPTKSALILEDGHLTLEEIIKLNLPKAEFAFLSACQTTTGDENLSEEAVHIAAGMLLAGYRGVVATMWSIQDELAPEVTDGFYAQIMKGRERPDHRKAAQALHMSVQKLRLKAGVSLTDWIPFVHLGL